MVHFNYMLKNPWVVIAIITVVLFGGAIIVSDPVAQNADGKEVNVIASHIKGNPEAAVSLVEYSDLQCPACATFQPIITELLAQYGDKIKFEYKHFPLPMHPFALRAAVAAEAAGQQGKFYEFHDVVFQNQDEWSRASSPNSFFIKYASDLGLDVEQFKSQMEAKDLRNKVLRDQKDGQALGITGTPTFFLNGEKMEFDTYQAFIEQVALAADPNALLAPTLPTESGAQPEIKFGI